MLVPSGIPSGHYTDVQWRNQKGISPNARTCKHLKELLGTEFEETRVLGGKHESTSVAAVSAKKRKDNGKLTDEPPPKKPAHRSAMKRAATSGQTAAGDDDKTILDATTENDPLFCINGIKRTPLHISN